MENRSQYQSLSLLLSLSLTIILWGCAGTETKEVKKEKESVQYVTVVAAGGGAIEGSGRSDEEEGDAILIVAERMPVLAQRTGTEVTLSREELLSSTTNSVTEEIARTSAVGNNGGVWGGRSRSLSIRSDRGNAVAVVQGRTPVDASTTGSSVMITRDELLRSIPTVTRYNSSHEPGKPVVAEKKRDAQQTQPEFIELEPFRSATSSPFSTFSIDVDGGSYTNVRGYIERGEAPRPGIVRIEELVNYFTYDYPDPTDEHPFAFSTEVAPCPWDTATRLVRVALQGKRMEEREIPAMNVVFLIDVSGSMSASSKLPLLKQAFGKLVERLRPEDHIAIVTYAGSAGVVLESTGGDEKEKIMASLEALRSGGSTAGAAGIRQAYDIAQKNLIEGGNNRVILATDGDFNVGVSSRDELVKLIEEQRGHGVFLSLLGFGHGNYRDAEMEQLADNGDGVYYYIDRLAEAERIFGEKITGTTTTIAKDVKLQIQFNPEHVVAYRLIGYDNRRLAARDFANDHKDAGDLGAGHSVTAFYEVIPAESQKVFTIDTRKNDDYVLDDPPADRFTRNDILLARLRYKLPKDTTSRLIEQMVPDDPRTLGETDDDFRFATAVTLWGKILRNGKGSPNLVLNLARNAVGEDPTGEREEFIDLMMTWMRQTEGIADLESEWEVNGGGSTIR